MWLLLLVRMLIPVVVETPISVYNYVPAPPENSSYIPYLMPHLISISSIQNAPDFSPSAVPPDADLSNKSFTGHHNTHETATTNTSGFSLSIDKALMLLWLAGVLAFGTVTVYKNCKFRLSVRREQPVSDNDILDLFNECRSTLGLQKKVEIIVTDRVKSPAIYGYFKPQLLLPRRFLDALTKHELYCIFLHELGHVKRHDIGVSWLAALFQVIYWFNPLVWYAFHYLRADQEAACDAYVLSKIKKAQPTDYARTIVNLLERFVQNRQLPSLAGIIENKSQIGRRISMILEYKKITQKMTLVSVLLLFITAGVFFSFSNGRLSDPLSSRPSMTQSDNSDLKRYKSDDWSFSLDMPKHWAASPSLPADLSGGISFGSNDGGIEALCIYMAPHDPELSLDEELDIAQKQLANEGYGNFVITKTTIGSNKALILDYDKKVKDGTLRVHAYVVAYQSIIFSLGFVTTRPDASFELYDRIAKTFEFHEPPVVEGFKKYLSPDGSMEMEIPANWKTLPPSQINNGPIRFGTPQNGLIADIYGPAYVPWDSLENMRAVVLKRATKSGWKDFTNSETVINGRKTLIADGNNGSTSVRGYLFENGNYKYVITFYGGTKNGMPADMLEEYGRVMKSIKFIKANPIVATFKEYAGPDLGKPIASGMKRYISPEADFTVDVPGDWRPYAEVNESGKSYQFGTPENGLAAIFYPRAYLFLPSVDERRDDQVKINTDAGLRILGKSEAVINGRRVLILDSNIDSANIRNYFFKEGDYIYSVLFYAFNTEGIPAGKQEEYERIMRSINIIKVNPKDDEFERKGGTRLILQVGTDEVVTQELDQAAQIIARDLRSKKIAFNSSKRGDGFVIKVSGIDSSSTKEVEDYLQNVFKQSYDIQSKIAEGRTDFTLTLRKAQIRAVLETTIRQTMETLRRRMTEMSISNPRVRLSEENNQGIKDQVIVEFPDVDGPDRVKALLSMSAQLKVCLVHEKYTETFSSIESAVNTLGKIPEGYHLLPYGVTDRNSPAQFILVRIDPVLTSKDIKTARESRDQNGSPAVSFYLTADGGDRFAKATSEHIGRRLAIVFNGRVSSAPTINAKIGSEGIINGKFTQQSAEDLALLLRSGALPASVRILQEIHVPPADR